MKPAVQATAIALHQPLFRRERQLRIALAGTRRMHDECAVQFGFDEARMIDLPSVRSLRDPEPEGRALNMLLVVFQALGTFEIGRLLDTGPRS